MVVFTVVFGRFANFPSKGVPYPIFSLGAAAVDVLRVAVELASMSLVANRGLVTKVYFPRVLRRCAAYVPVVDFLLGVHRARRADGLVRRRPEPGGR